MLMKKWIPILLVPLIIWGYTHGSDERGDKEAVRKKTEDYVKAYNDRDAEKIAGYWLEDAEYTNLNTGRTVSGREEIRDEFAELFKNEPDLTLEVSIESISFPSSGKAVGVGTATVTDGEGDKEITRFRVTFQKMNGDWYLASEGEAEESAPPSNYEQLKGLEWLIGNWEDSDEDVQVESTYEWDKYKNFIKQHYTVQTLGKEALEGKVIIGWDPVNETIRSWHFDSHGGFAEGEWKKMGDRWVVESLHTLPDGGIGSQIQVITPEGSDAFTYEISGRVVDGEILPNIEPIKVIRKRG